MKHVVCFSKGHSSGLVAIEVTRKFGKENVILLNNNLSSRVESEDVKRFGNEISEYLGIPLTYANCAGIIDPDELPDQFDVCIKKKGFKQPDSGNAFCTWVLKTEPFYKWLNANIPNQECIIYYGYDNTPKEILRKVKKTAIMLKDGWETDYVLIDWKDRTIHNTEQVGIRRPNSYEKYKHANCEGCLKAGMQHWYVTYCNRYDLYEKGKKTEKTIGYTILRKTTNNVTVPISLEELEPTFKRMKCAGVPDTEHLERGKFKKYLKRFGVEEVSMFMPCDCVVS